MYTSLSHRLTRLAAVLTTSCFLYIAGSASAQTVTPEGQTLEVSTPAVALAQDGKALVPIVIAPGSSEALKKTAAELAGFLKRITGADFAIKESTQPEGITLGTLAQFPDDTLKEPLAIKNTYDGVEAFVIRSNGGKLRLIGNTDLGAAHAAYRFLELIGYRAFFMGPNWEVVPELKTLSFALNESSRPAIWSRKYAFTRLFTKADEGDPVRSEVFQKWMNANLMAQSIVVNTSHAWQGIPDAFKNQGQPFKKIFAEHPEYFALVDGRRTGPQFCVTNPGLQKVIIDYVNQYFEVNPTFDMVSLDPADQPGWCTCDDCKKLGHHSAQAFFLANVAAKALQKSHPGKYVGVLAYSWHSDPPSFVLEPNVFIQLTVGMNASKLPFDELFAAWREKCQSIGIYEYFTYWEMDRGILPGNGPHNEVDNLPARIKKYAESNVVNITAESGIAWGAHGYGYYMANKFMWNPSADIKTLKADFFTKAFGPAAPAMARYYERLDLSHKPLRGIGLLRQCVQDLKEATVLAKGRPDVLARLDDLKANMIYTYLGEKTEAVTKDDAVQKPLALEWFTWAYRTRNNYMTDWMTFRGAVGNNEYARTLAAKFNEPSWNYRKTSDNPWRNNEPLTSKEINGRFDAIAAEWGAAPAFTPLTFSNTYVLRQGSASGRAAANNTQAFLGTGLYLLASPEGKPLKFSIHSVPSPNLERKDAAYELTALDGKTVTKGTVPEGDTEMDLKVPGPGVYRLFCRRGGAGWKMTLAENQPAAVLIERDHEFRPQSMTGYFYVPKGTAQIVMYAQDGSGSVSDASGKPVYTGQPAGDYTIIKVPDSMDGKVWSLTGKFRNLWFLNIPNVLATDPTKIIIPKEVADKDGLAALK